MIITNDIDDISVVNDYSGSRYNYQYCSYNKMMKKKIIYFPFHKTKKSGKNISSPPYSVNTHYFENALRDLRDDALFRNIKQTASSRMLPLMSQKSYCLFATCIGHFVFFTTHIVLQEGGLNCYTCVMGFSSSLPELTDFVPLLYNMRKCVAMEMLAQLCMSPHWKMLNKHCKKQLPAGKCLMLLSYRS